MRFLDPDLLLALSSTTCWNVTLFPFDLDRDLDADLDLLRLCDIAFLPLDSDLDRDLDADLDFDCDLRVML